MHPPRLQTPVKSVASLPTWSNRTSIIVRNAVWLSCAAECIHAVSRRSRRRHKSQKAAIDLPGSMLAKGVGDANAAAQDAALEALLSYLNASDEAQAAK